MSWAEIYKVNSDLQGEPLNFLNYLQDIKLNGLDSYVLFIGNARIWEELYLNSLYLFSDKGIRETVYTAFSETDIDNLFNKSAKLGEQLNAFYRTDIYSLGNADDVVKGMTVEYYNSLEQKFKDGYDRYVTREQEKETIGKWFNSTFNLNNADLESLATIDDILANTEATNAILNNSNAMVALTMCKSSMDAVVASQNAMDLLGQYILKITVEPPVLRAILKNDAIRNIVINSMETMTIISTNTDTIAEIFDNLECVKILISKQNSLDKILENNEAGKEVVAKMLALKSATSNNKIYRENIATALNQIESQCNSFNYKDDILPIMKKVKELFGNMKEKNNILNEELNRQMEIADMLMGSENVFKSISNNAFCMDVIAKNPAIMSRVVNLTNVMNTFANSSIAMSILANNSNAMNYIKNSSTAMAQIVDSSIAMTHIAGNSMASEQIVSNSVAFEMVLNSSLAINIAMGNAIMLSEICKVESASIAIAEKIQNYNRSIIESALNSSSAFTKTSLNVGNGNGTYDSEIGTNTIYIPVSCHDDGDTNFASYYGCKNSLTIVPNINKHSGTVSITQGISLRGARVVGTGNSVGYITFNVYTAK